MKKEEIGFDKIPDRYKGGEDNREAVDIMRDACMFLAEREGWGEKSVSMSISDLSDLLFEAVCLSHYLKYTIRVKDPQTDLQKAEWWRQMRLHIWDNHPDPRSGRTNFNTYSFVEFDPKKYKL